MQQLQNNVTIQLDEVEAHIFSILNSTLVFINETVADLDRKIKYLTNVTITTIRNDTQILVDQITEDTQRIVNTVGLVYI